MAKLRLVVTGASSGIGRACALRFAELGYAVFAGVRTAEDGEALRLASAGDLRPLLLDVTDAESIRAAVTAVGDEPLAGLVNNAGIAVIGPLELVPLERWRRGFDVNVLGLVAATQAFLPLLRAGPGRIVNIGSIAGRSALPGSGVYDASKFALEAISDALRMELHPWKMFVSLIEPGAIATPIWSKSLEAFDNLERDARAATYALYAKLIAGMRKETADAARTAIPVNAVTRAVEHALTAKRPKARYLVGAETRFWLLLNLLPDAWRDRLILDRLMR